MGSTNVPNKKENKREKDNPTSANMQTILTDKELIVPKNTEKGKTHDLGPTEYDINLGNLELVVGTCELGKDDVLRDKNGNTIIAMQKSSYRDVKDNQVKRGRYTRTRSTSSQKAEELR
jgi:hypothetical protein